MQDVFYFMDERLSLPIIRMARVDVHTGKAVVIHGCDTSDGRIEIDETHTVITISQGGFI